MALLAGVFLCLYVSPSTTSLIEEILQFNGDNNALQTCLKNLSEINFVWNDFVLYSHWNSKIFISSPEFPQKYQTQVYNSRQNFDGLQLSTFIRFTAYVLITTHGDQFKANLRVLVSMAMWNARAKFIIILENVVDREIWQTLIRYYVVNAIVIQTSDMQLFTYFPYSYENLRDPYLEPFPLGFCHDFDISTLNIPKVPKQWRNTTVIVAYMHLHPYILDAEHGTGLEVQLVDLMKGFMKYNVRYSEIHYADWGVYYPQNGTYSGPVGAIQRYEADFVIGHFHLREVERIIDFDTTFSYMDDDICWIVPIAVIRSHWQNIMNIFNKQTWIMTIVSMFVAYISWQAFIWLSPYVQPTSYRYYRNPLCSMEVPFVSFLGLPIMHEPKSWALRLLFLVIFAFCFILVTGWKSYLIVSLTHDISEYQMHTLTDITRSSLTIGIYHELIDLHCAEKTPEGDYICKNADRNLCNASHACLDRVAYQRDMTTIATKKILRYLSPQRYRTTTGREMVYIFRHCIAKDYTVQYYTSGHPLFERSNDLLIWIRTGGFVDNLDNRLEHEVELNFQEYVSSLKPFDITILSVVQLEGMFLMLLGGLGLSTIGFILELIVYKYRDVLRYYQKRIMKCFRNSHELIVEQ